jgi:hypothetical protein
MSLQVEPLPEQTCEFLNIRKGREELVARLADAEDPILRQIYADLIVPYFSFNERDSLAAIRSYLNQNSHNETNHIRFCVGVALRDSIPLGTTIFAVFGAPELSMMTGHYTAVRPEERGKKLARRLDAYRALAATAAVRSFGYERLDLSVITIPRTAVGQMTDESFAKEFVQSEKVWRRLGYRRLDFPFVQLPLAPNRRCSKQSIWLKLHSTELAKRDSLWPCEVKRVVDACNYFRNSPRSLDSYSEYRLMLRTLSAARRIMIVDE